MAVELLIAHKGTKARQLVLVATTSVFGDYWRVGCKELQLSLVPLIEDSLFEPSDIPNLIVELGLLRDWFQKTQDTQTSSHLLDRVDGVINAFERVLHDPNLTIF